MNPIKTIAKKLTFGLLKTILLSIIITLAMMFLYNPDQNPFAIAVVISIIFILGILSVTIYLNLIPAVRQSVWLSALSFFALPVGLPLIPLITSEELRGEWVLLIFTQAYIITHFYYFLRFREINLLFTVKLSTNIKVTVTKIYLLFVLGLLSIIAIRYIPTRPWKLPYYQGYVTDMEGNPIAGATVKEDLEIYHETVTDSTGYFRLKRNKDVLCRLIARKDSFLPDTCETQGFHFERGPEYYYLKYPDRITLRKDTASIICNGIRMYWKHLEGNWVLTNYFDNIMRYKAIAQFRITTLASNAWAFRISNDSIHTAGLVHGMNLACYKDTNIVAFIDLYNDITFNLLYDMQANTITAQRKKYPNEKYIYRKATGKLNEILTNTPFNSELWDVMAQYYTEELIAGTYKNVVDDDNILILSPDGTMSGFGKYNHYSIYTFFGTYFPFDNHDALTFTDTITGKCSYFTWKLNNNKLTLTQIFPDTVDESYYISTRKFGFIKK